MSVIFISHSSKDNLLIKDLGIIEALKKAGFENIFLDFDEKKGIKIGENWKEKIYKNMKKSHIVVLLLSPNWINSQWCFAEFAIAEILGKTIIPLIINNTNGEVDKWLDKLKEQADVTTNHNAIHLLIKRLKELTLEKQRGYPLENVKSPYPGLMSFDIKEAAIFFGREKETNNIISTMKESDFYLEKNAYHIISASGLGKSSLLKAGILAYLIYHEKDNWSVLPVMTPTNNPISALSAVFAKYFDDISLYEEIKKGLLSDDYKRTISIIKEKICLKSNKRILLPIDQLEELYTLSNKKEREQFIKILKHFLNQKGGFIITTLRADYLPFFQKDKLSSFLFEKAISDTSLNPLTEQGIIDVIKKPAELFGIEITDGLVERLRKDMGETNAIPLLAFTLEKLYLKMKEKNLNKMDELLYKELSKNNKNPMEELLNTEADKAFEKAKKILNEEDIKNIFLKKLINISFDEKVSKRTILINEFTDEEEKALEPFVKKRLLIKDAETISIIHESLIDSWNKLQNWISENKEILISLKLFKYEYYLWELNKKNKLLLLSGVNFKKYYNLYKKHPQFFSEDEKKFIIKSKKQNRKEIIQIALGTITYNYFKYMIIFAIIVWIITSILTLIHTLILKLH